MTLELGDLQNQIGQSIPEAKLSSIETAEAVITNWLETGDLHVMYNFIVKVNTNFPPEQSALIITELFGIYHEWTELSFNEQQEILTAVIHEQREALTAVAHDIRSPLSIAVGFAETLAIGYQPGDEGKTYLETIERNIRHSIKLLSEVMEYSDNPQPNLREIDLHGTILEAVLNINALPEECVVSCDVPMEIGNISSDDQMLLRILQNLIGNAVKYSNPSVTNRLGEVNVAVGWTDDKSDRIILSISDNGLGIAPEDIGTIFEPFIRTESARRSSADGIGLGLATVKKLCDLLGIAINVQSELGVGTTFNLIFPN